MTTTDQPQPDTTEAAAMSNEELIETLCDAAINLLDECGVPDDELSERLPFLKAELLRRLAADASPSGHDTTEVARDVIAHRIEVEFEESDTTADVVTYRILQDLAAKGLTIAAAPPSGQVCATCGDTLDPVEGMVLYFIRDGGHYCSHRCMRAALADAGDGTGAGT